MDLSVHNKDLEGVDVSSPKSMQSYIDGLMAKNQSRVGYGGYLEKRNLYKRSSYFNSENTQNERTIHLGLDLWIEAGTPIYTPLDATLHSFQNNTHHGDYGPTLILKHEKEGVVFYTLYGHPSLEALEDKWVGQSFQQGDCIATLGAPEVNGDYAPHLHFQVIKDLEGYTGDYPGVSSEKNLDHYRDNCPDPNLLLRLSF